MGFAAKLRQHISHQNVVQFAADADEAVNTKALEETGIIVLAPSPSLKSGMAKIGSVIAKEWATSAGADGEAMLAAYRM